MSSWALDSVFYHIYPLGFCGAPDQNDFVSQPVPRLNKVLDWIEHMKWLGINAVYLGPVFESTRHGYDTVDYFKVDRRLGDEDLLRHVIGELHRNGIRVILDAVFNHVGRDFWAFQDVLKHKSASQYWAWFKGLDDDGTTPCGDSFSYVPWRGHYELVEFDHFNPQVREHIFTAIRYWVEHFNIDGLRLDVAEDIDIHFLQELSFFCQQNFEDFWLLGEVIHGDYRQWANPKTLDSVTNYECYKGLYSSHVDQNYYEIAYSFQRQFGENGMYRQLPLYNFVDNHDVARLASNLTKPEHLYPIYCLLFTMPGVPSIYYGSEWGITGDRGDHDDRGLRPNLDLHHLNAEADNRDLVNAISRLSRIRKANPALKYGNYHQIFTDNQQFAFQREFQGESIVVIVNSSDQSVPLKLYDSQLIDGRYQDLLNPGEDVIVSKGCMEIDTIWSNWGKILCHVKD
jgi:glycosidase